MNSSGFFSRGKVVPLAVALVGLLSSAAFGSMAELVPVSYSFDKATGAGGYFSLADETGRQLIDGQYGVAPYTADLGNGAAYEWVGWTGQYMVNINFDFGAAARIDEIRIGSVQGTTSDAVLPDVEILTGDGGPFWWYVGEATVAESAANNGRYRTYVFPGLEIMDQFVRVRLTWNTDGPWTLTDEIDFYTYDVQPEPELPNDPQHMPEPMTMIGLMAGLGGLGLYLKRRKAARA